MYTDKRGQMPTLRKINRAADKLERDLARARSSEASALPTGRAVADRHIHAFHFGRRSAA